jgi:hypothetical protein
MSSTTRQNNLLLAEDWQKIYQSFRNADFQSYDFENLRRTMIDYIRTNFPEDFNDYIESSEYLALIDLIAFVGQSIAFRADLNARENFLELAERRDSILRLARLVSYNASRNNAAQGLLKFNTVQTTENVLDSNGRDLAGQYISWNDSSNPNWYDQFVRILNAAFPQTQQFGNPADSATIYGIPTAQYRFNANNTDVPVYSFTKTIAGRGMDFEITSTTFKGETFIYEEPPKVANQIACIYKDDGYGAGSPGTGFFFNFVQGTLNTGTFTITNPSTNESIDIDSQNINNSDVWLYQLNQSNGLEDTLWTKISALTGNNVIYNSLNQSTNTVYAVNTRVGDAVSLNFADGVFGKLPNGNFRVYYRISNGLTYTINPADIVNISIAIPYVSALGTPETLTISLSLASSVINATASETNASIKQNAPQTYYTQNRMITGEDYNISPLASSLQVAKVKSINRTSSGISRYFDLTDPTGKYSSTNLFADDGVIYKQEYTTGTTFSAAGSQVDGAYVQGIIDNKVLPILEDPNLRNFFYSNFVTYTAASLNVSWFAITKDSNSSSGYIGGTTSKTPFALGTFTLTDLSFVTPGALIKFTAPSTTSLDGTVLYSGYFNTKQNNTYTLFKTPSAASSVPSNGTLYLWARVTSVNGDGTAAGTGTLSTGFGPIVLSKVIPSGAVVSEVIPEFSTSLTTSVQASMVDLILSNSTFGLRYDASSTSWQIVFEQNLNNSTPFSLQYQGNNTNTHLDASWMLLFTTNTLTYTITARTIRYVFESDAEVSFYFDDSVKIYDIVSSNTVTDTLKVLNINSQPDIAYPFTVDYSWQIVSEYIGQDGYIDPKKVIITFADPTNSGVVDNPQQFLDIVSPLTNTTYKYIIEQKYEISMGQEDYKYVPNNPLTGPVVILPTQSAAYPLSNWTTGQHFYFIDTQVVMQYVPANTTSQLQPTLDYKVYVGRDNLRFQYTHSADYDSRIDPGASNIIDVYVLTHSYDTAFRQWAATGGASSEPLPPSQHELNTLLSPNLNLIKSISDEIVYHPVNYTLLFGSLADANLQATFEVMINPSSAISSANVTARVLTAINEFFALENWNFGDTFYFTELSTYVMNQLAPDIITFVIVPAQTGQYFGSLFEIKCPNNSIFLSCATTANIQVVAGLTSTNLKTVTGTALASTVASQQITSANYGANS